MHRRVRGALEALAPPHAKLGGPLPRARGSLPARLDVAADHRSTPACAELSSGSTPTPRRGPVHPRVRGALTSSGVISATGFGPPPRARGSPAVECGGVQPARSTPACAGLSWRGSTPRFSTPVHPRVRGALVDVLPDLGIRLGPPPRARGSPARVGDAARRRRSTPACAGLSKWWPGSAPRSAVHPRVRGALHAMLAMRKSKDGPPPRARGSQRFTCGDAGRYQFATFG